MLTITRLTGGIVFLAASYLSCAQTFSDGIKLPSEDRKDGKYYKLEYKKSSRVIIIENPSLNAKGHYAPPSTATSTPVFIDSSDVSPKVNRVKTNPVDESPLTGRLRDEAMARVVDQTCELGAVTNRASFVICNDEAQEISFYAEDYLRYAVIDAEKSQLSIEPGRCGTLFINGDDSDLQFDCSGIFGVVFKVRLQSDSKELHLPVPIRPSKPSN